MAQLNVVRTYGYSEVVTVDGNASPLLYVAGLNVDADGSPRAYSPDSKSGLDDLANAGKPGNWWGVATDNNQPNGTPIIQGPNDPAPGFYVSTTSLQNSNFPVSSPSRYVNAETINFIVLPIGFGPGVKVGDFAVVIDALTADYDYAVYADEGPSDQIGEGSMALAASLGYSSNPRNGGTGSGLVYVVFPGSSKGFPASQDAIDHQASGLFTNWGGLSQVKACYPLLAWPE